MAVGEVNCGHGFEPFSFLILKHSLMDGSV